MRKKLFLCLIIIFLMCSCATYDKSSLIIDLESYLSNVTDELNVRANNTLSYYSFYLPSDMTSGECLEESVVLNYSNSKIVLNLNIAGLIKQNYYQDNALNDDGFFSDDKLIYYRKGVYVDIEGKSVRFVFKIYEGNPYFLIHMMSENLNIYSYCLKEEALETSKHIMLVARSTKVNTDDLISNYSQADVVEYERKQVDLFQYVIPKSGYLSELLTD